MTETATLIETSFAGAVGIIAAAQELPEQTRRHWTTSVRKIARALDRPIEVIPARYSAVRADLAQLHHAPAGLTVKTLQNHESNVKSALLWLAREKGIPEHGAPLSPDWEPLRATASRNKGQSCSIEIVVLHAVQLREQHLARRGGRGGGRRLRDLPFAMRKTSQRCLPAPAGSSLERQCWVNPRLASESANGSVSQTCSRRRMGRVPA
jgi:hypothetical protein